MPIKFQGFSDELIRFIWNFAGTYWAFRGWSKTPKKGRGSFVWVNFTHFCLSVFYVNLFLENHSIFCHEILYSFCWYNNGGQYIQTMPSICWGPFWDILGTYFGIGTYFSWYLFNILSCNFLQMFFAYLWVLLILFFDVMFPSSDDHFRVIGGLFWYITSTFWKPFNMLCEILYRCSWFSFLGHCTTFSISWRSWGAVGGYFWAHFGQCLSNTS